MPAKTGRKSKRGNELSAGGGDPIAETLRKAAERRGYTAADLRRVTGLPHSILRRWILGAGLRTASASKIAAALGLELR